MVVPFVMENILTKGTPAENLCGKIFGKLTVIAMTQMHVGKKPKFRAFCLCLCSCGEWCSVLSENLKSGKQVSCGCHKDESVVRRNTTHGMGRAGTNRSPEYNVWACMIQRCTNPKNSKYRYWGGRGITVCERWLNSFENFFEDMGIRPPDKWSIDRIDNEKGYFKENCRWATRSEQNKNRRKFKIGSRTIIPSA